MQFFHKIAASIYCDLVVAGLKRKPPLWLFNKPKKPLKHTFTGRIAADISFTPQERQLILDAAQSLEWFSNGLIKLDVAFQWHPSWKVFPDSAVILRVDSKHETIVKSDGYYKTNILGLCSPERGAIVLYLVHDRLHNERYFHSTVLHELGHYIGMSHTKKPSIMYGRNHGNVLYMSYYDAVEFCRIFKTNLNDLRYFKLK